MTKLISKRFGLRCLGIYSEAQNPTGSHKDRAAVALVRAALMDGYESITAGTCGNFGMALAHAAARPGIKCAIFSPRGLGSSTSEKIKSTGAELHLIHGEYEDAVAASSGFASTTGAFNANPIGEAGEIAIYAYQQIARDISAAWKKTPQTVWVSTGNGTTAVGLYRGFLELGQSPKIVAVGSLGNSPLAQSFKSQTIATLARLRGETELNRPLVNRSALHAKEALAAINASSGWAVEVTDEEMIAARNILQEEHVTTVAASAAALAGLLRHLRDLDPDEFHVVLLTS